jgi:hypothetical protein
LAATTWNANYQIDTDAHFRALFSPLSTALAAAGWTLVTSVFATGTNWTDVTAPAADATARVTEIWAMGDATQATVPLYMKIEYGRNSTTNPALQVSWGTGASSTTILGSFGTGMAWATSGSPVTNGVDHYMSATSSRAVMAFNVHGTGAGASGVSLGFSVERRKKADGTDDTTGFLFTWWSSSSIHATLGATGTVGGTALTQIPVAYSGSSAGNLTFGGDVCIAPVLHCLGPSDVGMNMVGFPTGSWSAGQTFSATVFTVTVTYLALAVNPIPTEPANQSLMRLAIRYD